MGSSVDSEARKDDLEQPAGLLRRKIGSGRLLADNQLELGHKLKHAPSVRPKRPAQFAAPSLELDVALAQKAPDQPLESLRDSRVGNIASMLVKFARGEKTTGRHEGLVQLIDDRGFADPGISGNEHQLGCACCGDTIIGTEQGGD